MAEQSDCTRAGSPARTDIVYCDYCNTVPSTATRLPNNSTNAFDSVEVLTGDYTDNANAGFCLPKCNLLIINDTNHSTNLYRIFRVGKC